MQNETHQNMSDTENIVATEAPAQQNLWLDLKAAREANRMSVTDVANALKISPSVVDSLESGDWASLPGRTFIVGILRAYGRMLDVSVDALVAEVPGGTGLDKGTEAMHRRAPIPSKRDGEAKRQSGRMLRFGVFLVLIAIVTAYWVPRDIWDNASGYVSALIGGTTKQPSAGDDAPAVAVPVEQSASTTQQSSQPQTSVGTLELRFAAPAWVEVRDFTGRIIYSQLNAAGTTQFVTGTAPLDIMVGNAKQVQARWRDEPVKLDQLSSDDVARKVLR